MDLQRLTLVLVQFCARRAVPHPDTTLRIRATALGVVLMACSATLSGQADRPFAPEQGRLRVEGQHFYDTGNRVWRWRGATQFLLFARYLNGEDITPQLEWLAGRGFNVLRVFGQVPPGFGADRMGVTGYERPYERADFDARLHAFFALLESRGLRCEYTVLTYADDVAVMRAHVQRVFDIAASHWNVFVEVANEPEHNRIDPVAVMAGVDRRGVLTAYGLDPGRHSARTWTRDVPVLDYGTAHDLYRDLGNSPLTTRAARDMQNTFGVPFVNDEPIGAIDPGHLSFRPTGPDTWGGVNGGGGRTVNRDVFVSAAAIAYMMSAGYTFHFQAGVEGRIPAPDMTVQNGVAAMLLDVAKFIPDDVPRGVAIEPALADGGYGVIVGPDQWVVMPMAPAGWSPTPPAGWRIGAVGPVPYLLRLRKDANDVKDVNAVK